MSYTLILNTKAFLNSRAELLVFLQGLADAPSSQQLILALPTSALMYSQDKIRGNPNISLATQDISSLDGGAYTGTENPHLLADIGVRYSLIGHPETRLSGAILEEEITAKIDIAVRNKIHPILYIGTSFDQENSNLTDTIIINLESLNLSTAKEAIIVYEDASHSEKSIQDVYRLVRKHCKIKAFRFFVAGNIDAVAIQQLKKLKFIDGFAIGHHSLIQADRQAIYEQCNN
jgi:triosephosphate isomerase